MLHVRRICINENGKQQCIFLSDVFEINRVKDEQDVERLYRFLITALESDENIDASIFIEVKEKKAGYAFELLNESAKEPDTDKQLNGLSERQREVLHLLCEGLSNKAIGTALNIDVTTVKTHIQRIYSKLGMHERNKIIVIESKRKR